MVVHLSLPSQLSTWVAALEQLAGATVVAEQARVRPAAAGAEVTFRSGEIAPSESGGRLFLSHVLHFPRNFLNAPRQVRRRCRWASSRQPKRLNARRTWCCRFLRGSSGIGRTVLITSADPSGKCPVRPWPGWADRTSRRAAAARHNGRATSPRRRAPLAMGSATRSGRCR